LDEKSAKPQNPEKIVGVLKQLDKVIVFFKHCSLIHLVTMELVGTTTLRTMIQQMNPTWLVALRLTRDVSRREKD